MADGVQSAQELARGLGVSQPTVSGQIAALGGAIERIGGGPFTRYALRRAVRGGGAQWPVYRVDCSGRIDLLGSLSSLCRGFRFQFEGGAVPKWIPRDFSRFGVFPGLPIFLQDIRDTSCRAGVVANHARIGILSFIACLRADRCMVLRESVRPWSRARCSMLGFLETRF